MGRLAVLASLLLAGCAPQTIGMVGVPPASVRSAAQFPSVQAIADAAVRDHRVPGIVIAIGVDGAPTRFITSGRPAFDADTAATRDTLWRAYSMTKPITGIAAMILIDDGKLALDQPIADLIPEYAGTRVLVDPAKGLDTKAASRTITVRDLLTHTAGLNYAILGDTPAIRDLQSRGVFPLQINRVNEARMRPLRPATLQEFGRRAARAGLLSDPGTRFSYSMGLDVLAAVIEKAAGMPYEDFVQRRLLGPLGMTSTTWRVPTSQAGRLATSYADPKFAPLLGVTAPPDANGLMKIDAGADSVYLDAPSFPYGGAGLVSTARDYDRFLHMLQNDGVFDGERVLRPETARLAKSDLLPAGLELRNFGPVLPDESTGFGAGGFVTTLAADGLGRRAGTFGWDGAAGTRAWVDTARRLRVTMMINVFGMHDLANAIDKAVGADLAAANGATLPAGSAGEHRPGL